MTLYQFNALNEDEQAEVVWNDGVRLAERKDDQYKYLLYQVGGFYVEVAYSPIENNIEKLKAFKNMRPLEPYLEQIEVRRVY